MKIGYTSSPSKGSAFFLPSPGFVHELDCFFLLDDGQFVLVVDLQAFEIVEHSHFVIWLVRGRVVEKVKCFQRGQHLQVPQNFVKVPELVVVDREGFNVQKDIEDAIDAIDFVGVDKQVLDSEALLQPLERSEPIVIEPDSLQIGKELKVDQDGGLQTPHVQLGCLLGLLVIFDGDGVPGVALHLLSLRSVLGEEVVHGLVHSVIQYNNQSKISNCRKYLLVGR